MGLGPISGSNVWLQAVICCDLPLLVYIYFSIYIYFHIYIFSSFFLVHPIPSSAPSPPLLNGRLQYKKLVILVSMVVNITIIIQVIQVKHAEW